MLQNTLVQKSSGGNPTTREASCRLVTRPRELNITFNLQYNDNRTAKLTKNYGKKTVKRKWKKQNIIICATWKVRVIAHEEE